VVLQLGGLVLFVCLFVWLVGWLVDWLVGFLSWSIGRSVGFLNCSESSNLPVGSN
jgi:membrane glycosyltransferase